MTLFVVSRDGKSINDFLSLSNKTKSDIKIVKNCRDLSDAKEGDHYIIIPPLPIAYQWSIRPLLHELKLKNVTKNYNRLI